VLFVYYPTLTFQRLLLLLLLLLRTLKFPGLTVANSSAVRLLGLSRCVAVAGDT